MKSSHAWYLTGGLLLTASMLGLAFMLGGKGGMIVALVLVVGIICLSIGVSKLEIENNEEEKERKNKQDQDERK